MFRGILASILSISLIFTPVARAQDPSPTPSPTVTESGDVEGQRSSLEHSRRLAAKGQDSAEASRAVYATVAGVCIAACASKYLADSLGPVCTYGQYVAMGFDLVQIVVAKKRFKESWKELIGAGVVGGAYYLGAGAVATATRAVEIGPLTETQQLQNESCVAAALTTALTIAKEFPIRDLRKAQRRAEEELARLNGNNSATQMVMTVPDIGDGRVNAVEGNVARTGVTAPSGKSGGAGRLPSNVNAATAGCSSFALARDVSGTTACLNREGEKTPNIGSAEFAKAFEKSSGADLGQFLKSGVGDGATAEGLLKKATANVPGIDRSKFANLAEVVRSELGSTYRGGGGSSNSRRFASNSDEDRTAVIRSDNVDAMKFSDPTPLDTTLFGRASAQYLKFTKKKYFETP